MLKIARWGGVANVADIIKELKELAINAATDTNTDDDRAILQKKFDQALENINDIATTTNFNGKYLLDGTLAAVSNGTRTETQTKTVFSTVETTTTIESTTTTTEISTDPIAIDGNSVTEGGIYQLSSGFSGTLNVSAQNVKIIGDGSTLSNVKINVTASNANLWIENLNISNGDLSAIQFSSGTNMLIVKGTNNLTLGANTYAAAVNIGSSGELNIVGDG